MIRTSCRSELVCSTMTSGDVVLITSIHTMNRFSSTDFAYQVGLSLPKWNRRVTKPSLFMLMIGYGMVGQRSTTVTVSDDTQPEICLPCGSNAKMRYQT